MKNVFTQGTIAHYTAEVILANPNLTNEEVARKVRRELGSQTTQACVAWYKHRMRRGYK